jgi:hypothetical protein
MTTTFLQIGMRPIAISSLSIHLALYIERSVLVHQSEEKEHCVFRALLRIIPGLENRLLESSDEEVRLVADLVCHPRSTVNSLSCILQLI